MATLFASDLHLDGEARWAIDTFIAFLSGPVRQAEALYLLGDVFEVWVGDEDPDVDKARVVAALKTLTGAGVPCYALHGNRDFLLGADFATRSGVRLLPDPVVVELHGVATLLTHGDLLCTDDHAYQELRSIVQTPSWQARFLRLPLAARASLASAARSGSKAHTQRAIPRIMDVNPTAVEAAIRASAAGRLIHGHTHRPGIHRLEVDGRSVERVVLGAWYERASYLEVDASGCREQSLRPV